MVAWQNLPIATEQLLSNGIEAGKCAAGGVRGGQVGVKHEKEQICWRWTAGTTHPAEVSQPLHRQSCQRTLRVFGKGRSAGECNLFALMAKHKGCSAAVQTEGMPAGQELLVPQCKEGRSAQRGDEQA